MTPTPPKSKATLLSSVGDGWLILSYAVDGAVAASGMSVMVLQGKEVQIPGALALLLFQLCYIVPQLLTTPLTERLSTRLSARAFLLPVSMLASFLSSYILLRSLSTRSLSLFYAARVVNGFLRHPKILFPLARAESDEAISSPVAIDVNTLALPAMHVGFIVSGVLGDVWAGAVAVQRFFVYAEACVVAVTFAMGVAAMAAPKKKKLTSISKVSAASLSWQTASSLVSTLPDKGTLAAWGLIATFVALRVAAGIHQCMYPLVLPGRFGLSFTLTGVYLVVQDKVLPWVATPLFERGGARAVAGSALLFVVGAWAAPVVVLRDALTYFAVTILFLDIPTAVLQLHLMRLVSQLPDSAKEIKKGLSGGLLVYLLVAVKLLSAPLRLACVAWLPEWKYAAHVIALPAAAHVTVSVLSKRPYIGFTAACVCAAVLLSSGSDLPMSTSADL